MRNTLATALLITPLFGCQGRLADPKDLPRDGLNNSLNEIAPDCPGTFPVGKWRSMIENFPGRDWLGLVELNEKDKTSGGWELKDGRLVAKTGATYQSLISRCSFTNMELEFDWVIAPGGNAGIKYLVSIEVAIDDPAFAKGFEYQILDDDRHPDAKVGDHRKAGALYDILAPTATKLLHPPGQLNNSKIIFQGHKGEHWLNGQKVLSFDAGSAEFRKTVERSKFKKIAGFAERQSGHILIQHHGDRVEFHRLMIRAI